MYRLAYIIKNELNEEGNLTLHYTDNGCGFDAKRFGNKIFGLFQTFHGVKSGKGLSLFRVKG